MNKISMAAVLSGIFFCANIYSAYSQVPIVPAPAQIQVKTVDVNKDGTPDVAFHHDGKNVTKVEADTNFDGKPDVTVNIKDGKFESAEADTDYDGKPEKKFSSSKEFNEWVNRERPDFKDQLNRPDWDVTLMKF